MTRLGLIGQLGIIALIAMGCSDKNNNANGAGGAPSSGGTQPVTFDAGGAGGGGGDGGAGTDKPGMFVITSETETELLQCGGAQWEPEPQAVALQMVIDVSTSMNIPPPNSSSPLTKWQITRDALKGSLEHLPAVAELGVTFYPNKSTVPPTPFGPANTDCMDTSANLPITELGMPNSQARADILARLDSISIPDNAGTPTDDAYALALEPLKVTLPDFKYMLLITDGQPTFSYGCIGWGVAAAEVEAIDTTPIIDRIRSANTDNQIKTFVIGSPGSEQLVGTGVSGDARPWLSEAAEAGGTAEFQPGCSNAGDPYYCHFDMTTQQDFAAGLGNALQTITNSITPCDYTIQSPTGDPINPDMVNVVYSGADSQKYGVVSNKNTDCTYGWRYADDARTKIELCGDTCKYIGSDPFARVKIVVGCKQWVT